MVLEVLDFENSAGELHGWVLKQDLRLRDPSCPGWMVHPLCLQVAGAVVPVGFKTSLQV